MGKFERKYAFWFEKGSSEMYGGEILEEHSCGYRVKPHSGSYKDLFIYDVFIIVPYNDGVRLQRDLDKKQLGVVTERREVVA